jgi:riboflavin biosynthesis pyrimidine reductase
MHRLLPADVSGANEVSSISDEELLLTYAYPDSRPWLRANMVASVDGAATAFGRSGGLSSPADKRLFFALRAVADVVLVGAGTVRAERYHPARTHPNHVRGRSARGQLPAPVIAVVSASLNLDPELPLFRDASIRPLVLTAARAPEDRISGMGRYADILVVGEELVDASHAVDVLVNRGLGRILCEGGPTLLAHIAAAELLDELCLTVSPLLVGGEASRILRSVDIEPPAGLRLDSLLEEDGTLFLRYRRRLAPG